MKKPHSKTQAYRYTTVAGGSNKTATTVTHERERAALHRTRRLASVLLTIILMTSLGVALYRYKNGNKPSPSSSSAVPFQLSSGRSEFDTAFQLAKLEMTTNIQNNETFIAGAGWAQLWTRDTSYAVELAGGLVHPDIAKKTLLTCTERDQVNNRTVWLQDECGHFGGWPNLSDAIVGAQGAWELYLITGDAHFLKWAYDITKNSLLRAERDVYDDDSGLFRGCSSFMESNSGYPTKYRNNGVLVGKTKALSTNILYYNGYKLGALMGQELGAPMEDIDSLRLKAAGLREAIRNRLWLPDAGYYAYFADENGDLSDRMEGLGESLLLVATDFELDAERIQSIFRYTHRTNLGIPCLWPRFDIDEGDHQDTAQYYHNGRIWPFVQGYWAMATARHGMVDMFEEEVSRLVALSQQGQTFAEFYELDGQFRHERRRQLWSDAGFMSTVFHGLFGMRFMHDGIQFKPFKSKSMGFAPTISLTGIRYRDMDLNVYISGFGSEVDLLELDGTIQSRPFVSSGLSGKHNVRINLR